MVRVFSQFHSSQEGSVSEAMFLCVRWACLPSVLFWPVMPACSFPASVLSHWISDCPACLPYCTPLDSQDQGPFTVASHPRLLFLLVFPSPAHPCGLWSSSSAAGFHSPSSLSCSYPRLDEVHHHALLRLLSDFSSAGGGVVTRGRCFCFFTCHHRVSSLGSFMCASNSSSEQRWNKSE